MAEDEVQVVRPLDSEEIKDGIAQRLAEEIRQSLNSTCWLFGGAWPKFKASWKIELTLANMWDDERETVVDGVLHTHEIRPELAQPAMSDEPILGGEVKTVEGAIPYTPPNVFRKQHGLPIPTVIKRDDGSTEQKAVVFRQTRGKRAQLDTD